MHHHQTGLSIEAARSKRRRRALLGTVGIAALTAPVWAAPGLPFTESFSDTSLREDAGPFATTADWDTTAGRLEFHSANPIGVGLGPSTPSVELPNPAITRAVQLADLSGDGYSDLIVGVAGKSFVQINNGAGVFGPANVLPGPAANTRSVAIGDVDRDGDLDIVLGNFTTVSRLYLNNGDGITYTRLPIMPESEFRPTDSILLVDVDQDDDLDVVTGNHGLRNRIYKNTGDPLQPFGPEGVAGSDFGAGAFSEATQALVAGDVNNDGLVDLVTLNEFEPNRYFLNLGNGVFDKPRNVSSDADRTEGGALGDLNGDGYLDLVVGNTKPSPSQNKPIAPSKFYLNQGPAGSFFNNSVGVALGAGLPEYGRAAVLADVDHDGDLDIFLSTAGPLEVPTEENFLFLNDGTGNFDGGTPIGMEKKNHNSIAVGDVDNDGDLDLISGNETRDAAAQAGPDVNRLYVSAPPAGGAGPAKLQLRARAMSKEVDSQPDPITSVKLQATYPDPGIAAHNRVEYWVSSNGGQRWARMGANNRPVLLPAPGADLRWRAVLDATSPGEAAGPTVGAGAFALDSVAIVLNSSGPARGAIGDQSATQGSPLTIDAKFTDADGDPVFHSLAGLPLGSGLSIDPVTGAISGTPEPADAASSPIALTVTATDGALQASQNFTLTVAGLPGNDPPAFTSTPVVEASQDTAYEYAVTAADSDTADTLTITAVTVPGWLTLTDNGAGSATLAGTPDASSVGEHAVTLQVADTAGATATQSFTITVAAVTEPPPPANEPPAFTSTAPSSATEGTELVYAVTTSDPNASDTRTITGVTVPAWLTLTDNGDGTATLRGTPAAANVGANAVELQVTDAAMASANQAFTITVAAAPVNPPSNPPPATNPTPAPSGGSGGGGGSSAPWDVLLLGLLAAATLRRRLDRGAAV
jgi:hypothetical protein